MHVQPTYFTGGQVDDEMETNSIAFLSLDSITNFPGRGSSELPRNRLCYYPGSWRLLPDSPIARYRCCPFHPGRSFRFPLMNPDDPVCLCFHVTRRKVVNFIRIEKPKRPSQLSQCFGAGTGCGWCRPYLERLLASEIESQPAESDSPKAGSDSPLEGISRQEYAQQRAKYVRSGGGTPPPGAAPIDAPEDP